MYDVHLKSTTVTSNQAITAAVTLKQAIVMAGGMKGDAGGQMVIRIMRREEQRESMVEVKLADLMSGKEADRKETPDPLAPAESFFSQLEMRLGPPRYAILHRITASSSKA